MAFRSLRRPFVAAATVALAPWAPRVALADDGGDASLRAARDLFLSAEKDEDAQRWGDALEKLQRVSQVKLTSGVRYHTALCEEHLGRLLAALDEYRAAAAQARTENAADVLRLVDGRVADVTERVPHLVVTFAPTVPGATARLDGQEIATGESIAVDPASHALDADAPGRVRWAATVTVQERESKAVEIQLELPAHPPLGSPAPGRASDGGGAIDVVPLAIGVGAVSVAAGGLGAFLEAGAVRSDSVVRCAQVHETSGAACDSLRNPVRAWDWVALAAWTGAAAAGSIAIVTFVRSRPHAPLAARLTAGPGLVGVGGSF